MRRRHVAASCSACTLLQPAAARQCLRWEGAAKGCPAEAIRPASSAQLACKPGHCRGAQASTVMPMLRAVPMTVLHAASRSVQLRSGSLMVAISRTCGKSSLKQRKQ